MAPGGAVQLLAGLAVGRFAGESAVGAIVADVALVQVLYRNGGRRGAVAGAAVLVPMLAKRALPKLLATRLVRSGWSVVGVAEDRLARSGRVPGIASFAMRRLGLRTLFELRDGRVRPRVRYQAGRLPLIAWCEPALTMLDPARRVT